MKLGFVTAIFPELSLEEVLQVASQNGFSCVEVMCWPPGKAERRYAGVTHIDVDSLNPDGVKRIHDLLAKYNVSISGLGYYPNALSLDSGESEVAIAHIRRVIQAVPKLGLRVVNTFVGRNPKLSVDENWPRFLEVWRPLIKLAEDNGVRIGIENCPMFFGADEWPGGKNLASTPAIWRRMFNDIPSSHFGLNYDPSHPVLLHMDEVAPLREFRDRIVHFHAKDVRVDRHARDEQGVFAFPKLWHTPKLPGQGDVRWGQLLGTLADVGYEGPVCIEVEDRAYEGSLEKRKESLVISRRYLEQFIAG